MKTLGENMLLYVGILAIFGVLSFIGSLIPWPWAGQAESGGRSWNSVYRECIANNPELGGTCRKSADRYTLFTGQ